MSTAEAEMMALADLALELLYFMALTETLGYVYDESPEVKTSDPEAHGLVHKAMVEAMEAHGPIETFTDSKAAHDMCHRSTISAGARHVERRVLKMRELQGEGKVKVSLVPTAFNPADLFTKVLDNETFKRHRATIMNLKAKP